VAELRFHRVFTWLPRRGLAGTAASVVIYVLPGARLRNSSYFNVCLETFFFVCFCCSHSRLKSNLVGFPGVSIESGEPQCFFDRKTHAFVDFGWPKIAKVVF